MRTIILSDFGPGMVRADYGYGTTVLCLPDESGRFPIWREADARLRGILRDGSLRLIFEAGGTSAAVDWRWPQCEARRFLFLTGDEERIRVVVVPGLELLEAV